MWKTISVRGVSPTTPIVEVKDCFQHYGVVKDVRFMELGEMKVKCNRVILKLKMEDGKNLPVFMYNPIREGFYERWEISYPGSPKVCLLCFEVGHLLSKQQERDQQQQGENLPQLDGHLDEMQYEDNEECHDTLEIPEKGDSEICGEND